VATTAGNALAWPMPLSGGWLPAGGWPAPGLPGPAAWL